MVVQNIGLKMHEQRLVLCSDLATKGGSKTVMACEPQECQIDGGFRACVMLDRGGNVVILDECRGAEKCSKALMCSLIVVAKSVRVVKCR